MKPVGSSSNSSSSSSRQSSSHPPQQQQAPVSSSQVNPSSRSSSSQSGSGGRPSSSRSSSGRPPTTQQSTSESKQQMQMRAAQPQQAMSGKQQQSLPQYPQQSRGGGYPNVAGPQGKPSHPQVHGQPQSHAHAQQVAAVAARSSQGGRGSSNSHMRSHTADPASQAGIAQSKEAHQPQLTRQTGRTSLPGPGHHTGQQRPGHPQQGMPQHPQQGHHMPGPPPYREPKPMPGKGSRIPSLFDLPDSPEKKGGGSSMPPGYPATGLPPPYPEAPRPSGMSGPLFPTSALSPGFGPGGPSGHTKPRPPDLSRGASLEPGELADTPTPTHIKNMVQGFPFPKGHQQPGVPPGFPKMEKPDQLNTNLPSFPTAIEQAAPTSKLQQSLFDPDFDDFGDSTFNLGDLLTSNSLADPKEEKSKPRAENFTATCDVSALFEDLDSSQMSGGFGNFGNPGGGGGFKQEQQAGFVKQEKGQEAARVKTESDNRLSSSSRFALLHIR